MVTLNEMPANITGLEARMLRYIRWHWWRYGKAPTMRELAEGFDVHINTMNGRLNRAKQKGLVDYVPRLGWVALR